MLEKTKLNEKEAGWVYLKNVQECVLRSVRWCVKVVGSIPVEWKWIQTKFASFAQPCQKDLLFPLANILFIRLIL